MSVLRIKTWIMTAACAGLIGLAAGDAHAFCGKLFKVTLPSFMQITSNSMI